MKVVEIDILRPANITQIIMDVVKNRGHRSPEPSHTSSSNHGGSGLRSSMNSHSVSCNHGGYVDIGGYR